MSMGTILLIAVLALLVLVMVFLTRSASGNQFSLVTGRQIYYLTTLLLFFSLVLLLFAFLNHQFEFFYVYENSSRDLPLLYRVAAVWAGKEGSFLLWVFLLNICGVIVSRSRADYENILMMVITITQIFILILLVVESPFRYIWDVMPDTFNKVAAIPPGFDGMGMNPLLIDPWMVAHPPVLFLGYASATVPFGYAIAALLKRDYSSWLSGSYRWLLFSMTTLGIGIFLGGYWAYKVLGWGGYWGWDPVENSSLIPWLVAVALMHGMLVQRRTGSLVKSNLFMSLLYFVLVLYSTFLTRSGVLSNFSVHSFGGEGVSRFIIYFILFFVVISGFLFISRFKKIESPGLGSDAMTWQVLTAYGIITLFIYGMMVLLGTSLPILTGLVSKNPTPVTENFYNNISIPLGLLIMVLMVAATMAVSKGKLKKTVLYALGAAAVVLGILLNLVIQEKAVPILFMSAGLFVLFLYIYDFLVLKAAVILPSRLAHIGVAVMVLGIMASGYHSSTFKKNIEKGKEEVVGPVSLTFTGITREEKSRATFLLGRPGEAGPKEKISMAYYISRRVNNTLYREPHIKMGFLGDVYIIPEQLRRGIESVALTRLAAGREATLGGLKVTFKGFRSEGMMSGKPTIYADLIIEGRRVSPGIRFEGKHRHPIEAKVPGTKRRIQLRRFDVRNKIIEIYVEPGEKTPVPPDSMLVNVSVKRMIYLVWLGTILISVGGYIAMKRVKRT